MPIPEAERGVIDIRKLRDYCLSPTHPRGKHKARVFSAALGLGPEDAEWLRDRLKETMLTAKPTAILSDQDPMAHTNETIELLDTVALLEDAPEHKLLRGNVGTVVEELNGDAYMVEFVNNDGKTYGLIPLGATQLMVLRHEPGRVA